MKKILALALFILGFTVLTAQAYTDVATDDDYSAAIAWLTDQGVIHGYSDGTYLPNKDVNRAEFLKILMALKDPAMPATPDAACFADVPLDAWYAPYVCSAKTAGIVSGYSGNLFKPEQTITVVEASKIITLTLGTTLNASINGTQWYSPYLETLGDLNVYPTQLNYLTENVTRGELAEMLWRLQNQKTGFEATPWTRFEDECMNFSYDIPANVDIKTIESTWLKWMNDTRASQGLGAYVYNDQLIRTATVWSEYNKARGYVNHKREGTTAYYDYSAIEDWFEGLGLTFKNDGGYTYTENIGYGPYYCETDDCTTDLLEAIRYTYDYYLSEAGSSYSPHWNSIVASRFKEVGLGLTVDDDTYYLTVHYATSITSNPPPLCNALYE